MLSFDSLCPAGPEVQKKPYPIQARMPRRSAFLPYTPCGQFHFRQSYNSLLPYHFIRRLSIVFYTFHRHRISPMLECWLQCQKPKPTTCSRRNASPFRGMSVFKKGGRPHAGIMEGSYAHSFSSIQLLHYGEVSFSPPRDSLPGGGLRPLSGSDGASDLLDGGFFPSPDLL